MGRGVDVDPALRGTVRGCPAADKIGECPRCVPYMSGWTTAKIIAEVVAQRPLPAALCGVLRDRVEAAGGTIANAPAKPKVGRSPYRGKA